MLNVIGGHQHALDQYLLNAVASWRASGRRVLVIVPEQYTLKTECDLIEKLDLPGFFDIAVLSPSSLTSRVFSLSGTDGRTRIDANGKQMALAGALLSCKKELAYFASAAEKQGFIERVGAQIADFKRAGLSPEVMTLYAATLPEGARRDKLRDIALIYAAYDARLADAFVDGEDVLDMMLERLPDSGLCKDALAITCGFDVITGQMARVQTALAREAAQAIVLLAMDDQNDIYDVVRQSAWRLLSTAGEADVESKLDYLEETPLPAAPEIAYIEKEYFATGIKPYEGEGGAVRLYAAPNPYEEALFVAQEILLWHEKGVAFNEMAVVMADEAASMGVTEAALAACRVPAYIARKLPAHEHGVARMMLSSLRALATGFRPDDMRELIKSGYAPIAEEEIWRLENYMDAYGTSGKRWLTPFARGEEKEKLAAEQARLRLIEPLLILRAALKDAPDVSSALTALYEYLAATGVEKKLADDAAALEQAGMAAQAIQAQQIWKTFLSLMSQMHTLYGSAKLPVRRIAEWLEAGLRACELSSLPPDAGSVACGGLGSLPLREPKVLFVTGLHDGVLTADGAAVLSDDEKNDAQKTLCIYLGLDRDAHDALKLLDFYKTAVSARQALYLTRAQAGEDGRTLRPLSALSHIRRLLPNLVEEGSLSGVRGLTLPLAPLPTLDALASRLRVGGMDEEWSSAWAYLCQNDETRARADALKTAFTPRDTVAPLPREVTDRLFLERVMSVSRLESYAACPFKHFVQYGLRPQEKKKWELSPRDMGSFYHSAIEGFTRLLPSIPNWPDITREQCDGATDAACAPIMEEMLGGVVSDSARMRAVSEKYRRTVQRVAWVFTRGAKKSAFRTEGSEVRFGYPDALPPVELTLNDGSRVLLRGVIDRIDRYEGDEGLYLRVVDYKSGASKLSPVRVWWGEQLQLLLYLEAALAAHPDASPAGAYYMHIDDPWVDDPERLDDVEDALAKKLRLSGVSLKDAQIVRLMDTDTPPFSLVKMLNKDGDFVANAAAASLEELSGLIAHAHKRAQTLAQGMRSGEIMPAPLRDKTFTTCDQCLYRAICRRDGYAADVARDMGEMSFDALLQTVQKKG